MNDRHSALPLWPFWLVCLLLLIFFHAQLAQSIAAGIEQCGKVLIPSLFPFFIVSNLLLGTEFPEKLARLLSRQMRTIFHMNPNGAAAIIIGFLGGYPIGAKTAAHLYEQGKLTRTQTQQLLCFCNNTGPGIFFGLIGGMLFSDFRILALSYLIHICSALLTGFYLRPAQTPQPQRFDRIRTQNAVTFPQAVVASLKSTVQICGFVLAFSALMGVIRCIVSACFPALEDASVLQSILAGFLDLPSGIHELRALSDPALQFILANTFVGWGGLCVHLQTQSVLQETGIGLRKHFFAKLLQTAITFLLSSAFAAFCLTGLPGPHSAFLLLPVLFFLTILAKCKFPMEMPRKRRYNGNGDC